jgi:PAS domain S-box-containing protein
MSGLPKILVVDDDPGILQMSALVLRSRGYQVLEAANGAACLQLARDKHPDVILLDVQLPDCNGMYLCKQLKADPALVGTFVVLISGGLTSAEDATTGLEGGADDYIRRPIDRLEFLARIRTIVRIQQAEEQMRHLNATLEQRVAERTAQLEAANRALQADIAERGRAEAELQAREKRFRALIENSMDAIALLDAQGTILFFPSRSLSGILGFDQHELVGQNALELVHPNERQEIRDVFRQLLEKPGGTKSAQFRFLHKDGSWRWLECNATNLLADPDIQAVVINYRSITERKQAEMALRVSYDFLEIANRHSEMISLLKEYVAKVKNFTGCAAVGIRILDNQGNIPYQAYEGFSRRFYDSESPLSIESHQCMCINVIKGEADPNLSFYTKGGSFYMNGTTRFLATVSEEEKGRTRNVCNEFGYESVALVPIRLGDRILGLIHVADSRENMVPLEIVQLLESAAVELGTALKRVQSEEALRESQLLYHSLVENLPQYILRKDKEGRFTFGNKRFCASVGQPLEAILGKTDLDVYPPELAQNYRQDDQAVMATGKILDQVEEHQAPGAARTYVHVVKTPLWDAGGKIIGVQGIFWDVSREKRAEEELQAALAEKEVLLQEVHHRVKNNIQAIIHLIDGQLERIKDRRVCDSLKELQEQARTMALVYERLYQSKDLARIEVGRYLEDLTVNVLEAFGEGRDIAVKVKAAEVWLDVGIAMPCGLIVNELLTNALKHAFPPGRLERGKIWVELSVEGETYTLVVRDNGVGLPPGLDWHKTESVGLRLVQMWATHQLGGRLEVETRNGTAFTVVFMSQSRRKASNG